MRLKVVKLVEGALLPAYAHAGDSGFDLYLPFGSAAVTIEAGKWKKVDLGLSVELPVGFELQLRSKSGLALRHGIFMLNGVGTVDSGYRGEISALVGNFGEEAFTFVGGDKVCQGVISGVVVAEVVEVGGLEDSSRGVGGFGSTGGRHGGCSSCRGL